MLLSTVAVLLMFVTASPWVLLSQITRQECHGALCQPFAGQREPQVHVVQTFATPEECLKVREQMMQHVAEAEVPVNRLVEARNPAFYLRLTTTFVCVPDTGTTGEQVR